jgi:putative restriction endonuclease
VHEQINTGTELIDYAFMGTDPEAADNRRLRDARDYSVPIIYFLGIAPQRYQVLWSTYIVDWSAAKLKARLAFGTTSATAPSQWTTPPAAERKYALRLVRQRLHQATFREAVLSAYGSRCAVTGLPEPRLIDAAHIVPDTDEQFGQPVVRNGITLSKIHHAAFDANLIGIDPDGCIHVSDILLSMNDGPMFEHGVKGLAGRTIRPTTREADRPDRARLAQRFAFFRAG